MTIILSSIEVTIERSVKLEIGTSIDTHLSHQLSNTHNWSLYRYSISDKISETNYTEYTLGHAPEYKQTTNTIPHTVASDTLHQHKLHATYTPITHRSLVTTLTHQYLLTWYLLLQFRLMSHPYWHPSVRILFCYTITNISICHHLYIYIYPVRCILWYCSNQN